MRKAMTDHWSTLWNFNWHFNSISVATVILLSTLSYAESETSQHRAADAPQRRHLANHADEELNSPQSDLHFLHELAEEHRRAKRNVFYDMIDDFAGIDDDDDGSEEDEDGDAEDEAISESVETTTTRFGRFISPLAFSKISETLGKLKFIRPTKLFRGLNSVVCGLENIFSSRLRTLSCC